MRRWSPGLILLLAGCGGGWPSIDRASLPAAGSYPGQDAVVLDKVVQWRFLPGSEGPVRRETYRQRVLVLTPKGSQATRLVMGYNRSFSKVISARARVVHPDGEVEDFSRSDLGDHPFSSGSILYSNTRILEKDFGSLAAGAIVDWEVVTEATTPTWQFRRLGFGGSVPMASVRLEVLVPEGWEVEHTATQMWKPMKWAPERNHIDGESRYVWDRRDIPAVEWEPRAPEPSDVMPLVSVRLRRWQDGGQRKQAFASMEDYGRWMYGVQAGSAEPTPALRAKVQQILTGVPEDPTAQAEALYRWVQEQIRYVAIEIGMGGWRPHSAAEVFEYGYGDCKDKANLLRTMLAVAGIESHLAEIYSHGGVPRPFVMPGVGNGNHAILGVRLPGGLVFTDPTERAVPFGDLPPRDQGAQTLLIHPDTPQVHTTLPTPAKDNLKRLRIELEVPERGVATRADVSLHVQGPFAWRLHHALATQAKGDSDDLFERWDWLEGGQARNVTFDTTNPRSVEGTAQVDLPSVGTEAGARLVFRPSDLLTTPGADLRRTSRVHPVVYPNAVTRDTELRLRLAGAKVSELPEPVSVNSEFGHFEESWHLDDDTLSVRSLFQRTAQHVPAEHYEELLNFYEEIGRARSRQVVLRRGEAQ